MEKLAVTLTISLFVCTSCVQFHDSEQEERVKRMSWWSEAHPTLVDEDGDFLSNQLLPNLRNKRTSDLDGVSRNQDDYSKYYKLAIDKSDLHIQVQPNALLYSPGLVIEHRKEGHVHSLAYDDSNCHYTGTIIGQPESRVALAVCNGLTGIVMLKDAHYFIEPVKGAELASNGSHPHVVYKTAHIQPDTRTVSSHDDQARDDRQHCSSEPNSETRRADDERKSRLRSRRRKRSISHEYFVETLVVVDGTMVDYYRSEDINTYILTIMNMVSILFHDISLGNSVNIAVVKILLLDKAQEEIEGLQITHHADKTLDSFCKWQKSVNPSEPDPTHHDLALLITRLDICSRMNEPCSTLGLSQVSGMCQPGRSCNVNEDTGLALAYTIAHEIGHNFGMKHDGFNDCSMPSGEKSYIMFPEFLVDAGRPLVWSNCSRTSITKFLDREWGFCLLDEPKEIYNYEYKNKAPGVLYDVGHQCRLQYGEDAQFCEGIENLCTTLWCRVNEHCVTRLEPAAEGTICEWNNNTDDGTAIAVKWCFDGKCTPIGERPGAVDGGWAGWTAWTDCSRSCAGGVSISERHCSNPMSANGGKYCLGERKRYKICEKENCPEGQPSFRQSQCSEYNDKPYQNRLYEWEQVSTNNPCQLNCKPKDRYFSVMLNDMVRDGTPCVPGTRNMCITGRCRKVGCDWRLESNATEDRCGVCHGDGTTCKMVKEQFKGQQDKDGQGYVEATVIPSGARNIRIEEVAEANNYLALRAENGEYYLNGHWFIQWTGNYDVAGTTIRYERSGNKEGITAPGPIQEPLHIMLLFQTHNPGVEFEYTVPNENDTSNNTRRAEFSWQMTDWSHCTVSCGGGRQISSAVCTEKEAGLVDDNYCKNLTKPDDKAKLCNNNLCPAKWWTGPWQHCSVSCGEGGTRKRTVLCVRSLGAEEQIALDDDSCESSSKPETYTECSRTPPPCPSVWSVGPWSECKGACDTKIRTVECMSNNLTACADEPMPDDVKFCSRNTKCGSWRAGPWSQCTKTCEGGVKHREVECVGGDACLISNRPEDLTSCNDSPCSNQGGLDSSANNNRKAMSNSRYQQNEAQNSPVNDITVWTKLWNFWSGGSASNTINKDVDSPPVPIYNETWHFDDWGSCSVTCGIGQSRRKVWCPAHDKCDPALTPKHVEKCSSQPCIAWVSGSWSHCSMSCGEGSQQRNVQCINLLTDMTEETCDLQKKPEAQRMCTMSECNSVSAALQTYTKTNCEKDILAAATCSQLKDRGFCSFPYVSRSCCKLCEISNR